jgi:lambda family phage tail tape measure protein
VRLRRNQTEQEYREILDGLRGPQEALNEAAQHYNRILAEQPQFAEQAKRAMLQLKIDALEPLTDAVSGLARAQMQQQLDFSNDAAAAAEAYRAITDPAMEYAQTIRVLNQILAETPALQDEVNRAMVDARIAFLETQTTAQAGAQRGLLKIQQQVSDTATLTEDALVGAFNDAKEAMLDFFTTGEFELNDFVNNLQRRLADLALSGLIDTALGGAFKFLGGLGNGGIDPNTGGPAGAGAQGPGFANGGAFTVGGMGGIDSQQVAFRASPGERVVVQTPEQQRGGMGGRPANVNIYVTTPDAQSFQRSQGQILARTQRQLDRAARRDG